MILGHYILDEKLDVVEVSLQQWGRFFEKIGNRRVAFDKVGVYLVSTVFLGIDHNFLEEGPPHLFETMIFKAGSNQDLYCERYATWDEAVEGHERAVAKAEKGLE